MNNMTSKSEDTPIYLPTVGPNYFSDIDAAAEAAWDDGLDPTTVEAYACRITKAHVPYLADIIEESWFMEYEEPDAYDVEIPEPLRTELDTLYNKLVEAAPTVWVPIMSKRITLPAVDCPECGRWSNEPWPDTAPDCNFCGRPDQCGDECCETS